MKFQFSSSRADLCGSSLALPARLSLLQAGRVRAVFGLRSLEFPWGLKPVPRPISLVTSCRARVGRVTPCAPRSADSFPNGAHGVTRPTTSRNLFVTVLARAPALKLKQRRHRRITVDSFDGFAQQGRYRQRGYLHPADSRTEDGISCYQFVNSRFSQSINAHFAEDGVRNAGQNLFGAFALEQFGGGRQCAGGFGQVVHEQSV